MEEIFEGEILEFLAESAGERLDVYAARLLSDTRNAVQRRIEQGDLWVNQKPAKANTRLKAGDRITIRLRPPALSEVEPEDIPLSIVYQDKDIAVLDKPQGMVVHPAPGNYSGTLVNALLFQLKDLSGVGGEMRPGIVHRIDKLTSGLLVVAKHDASHRALAAQIKEHSAHRIYLALCEGNFRQEKGTVDAPIGRHPKDRKRMAIVPDGREAVTHYRILKRYGNFTLILAKLETGRTHQIRVHMASLGHPLAGDTVYGPEKPKLGLEGQALHAVRLFLDHPETEKRMCFSAPLPEYFAKALKRAGETGELSEIANMVESLLEEAGYGRA